MSLNFIIIYYLLICYIYDVKYRFMNIFSSFLCTSYLLDFKIISCFFTVVKVVKLIRQWMQNIKKKFIDTLYALWIGCVPNFMQFMCCLTSNSIIFNLFDNNKTRSKFHQFSCGQYIYSIDHIWKVRFQNCKLFSAVVNIVNAKGSKPLYRGWGFIDNA